MEDLLTYIGFSISLTLLLLSLLILCCIRGKSTNSNSIHKNIVFCIFCGELIYFAALKLRRELIQHEVMSFGIYPLTKIGFNYVNVNSQFPCKMIAMFLHYFWLSSFSWTLVDSLHLHRMLTELRDINHGQMRYIITSIYWFKIYHCDIHFYLDRISGFITAWVMLFLLSLWA